MPIRFDDAEPHPSDPERRSTPRLELISRIIGEAQTGETVSLINVSEGGLMVRGAFDARVGDVHEFRFAVDEAAGPLFFAARVMHVLHITKVGEPGDADFAVGLQFEVTTERQRRMVEAFIAACAARDR